MERSFQILEAENPGVFQGIYTVACQQQIPIVVVNSTRLDTAGFCSSMRAARGVCADFDGTVHPGSQWLELRRLMRAEDAKTDAAEAMAYFVNGGRRTNHGDIAFILGSVARLKRAGVDLRRIADVGNDLGLRHEVARFLRAFPDKAIISYGLDTVIAA